MTLTRTLTPTLTLTLILPTPTPNLNPNPNPYPNWNHDPNVNPCPNPNPFPDPNTTPTPNPHPNVNHDRNPYPIPNPHTNPYPNPIPGLSKTSARHDVASGQTLRDTVYSEAYSFPGTVGHDPYPRPNPKFNSNPSLKPSPQTELTPKLNPKFKSNPNLTLTQTPLLRHWWRRGTNCTARIGSFLRTPPLPPSPCYIFSYFLFFGPRSYFLLALYLFPWLALDFFNPNNWTKTLTFKPALHYFMHNISRGGLELY